MDACTTYVSMLKARRLEEEAGRTERTNRRADAVSNHLEFYTKRNTAMCRRMMKLKLKMTSHIEHDIFRELDEQTKWRHVMYQNVENRQQQEDGARRKQEELRETHLQNMLDHEGERFQENVEDDEKRWEEVLTLHQSAVNARNRAVCTEILEDVVKLSEKVIDFNDEHSLASDPTAAPVSAFNAVPEPLFKEWKLNQVYPLEAAATEAMLDEHLHSQLYGNDRQEFVNNLFSSLVNKVMKEQYPTPPLFSPEKPLEKVVVVLLGPKYSGKSLAAQRAAEEYNLLCVNDISLVEEALAELDRDLSPEELTDKSQTEYIDLARECREFLLNGNELSSEVLVKLVLHRIRSLPEEVNGLILDSVPSNVAGFEVLESALSGYDNTRAVSIPEEVLAPVTDDTDPELDALLVERPEAPAAEPTNVKESKKEAPKKKDKKKGEEPDEPLPPIELPVVDPLPDITEDEQAVLDAAVPARDTTGVHSVVHVDCTSEAIFRRFGGLRVDSETGEVYHLELNPPPLDRLPFTSAKDRTDADTAKLHEALQRYGERWIDTRKWIENYEELLTCVDGTQSVEGVVADVMGAVESAMAVASDAHERYANAEALKEQRAELEQQFNERTEAREEIRKQLAAIYTERGVDQMPPELLEPVKPVVESKYLPLPPNLPRLFLNVLRSFTEYYRNNVSSIYREVVTMVEASYRQWTLCSKQFADFWAQPDQLQKTLDAFTDDFNTMVPALRRDVQGKEELHLRTDNLADALWAVVDKRNEEGTNLIDALSNHSAYIDYWTDGVRILCAALVQLEVERFMLVKHLSTLYFSSIRDEPYAVEEGEFIIDALPPAKGLNPEPSTPEPAAGRGKDKKPPPKKGAQKSVVEEPTEKEDPFTAVAEKCITAMKTTLDKLSQPIPPVNEKSSKSKKGAEVQEVPLSLQQASAIVGEEFELAKARIGVIGEFVKQLTTAAIDRNAVVKLKLQTDLRQKYVSQVAAANTAVFQVRCAIEEERPIAHRMRLSGDKFSVDYGHPLAEPPAAKIQTAAVGASMPLDAEAVTDVQVLSCLTQRRAMEIIGLFKKIAPTFIVYRDDFLRIIRKSDYDVDGTALSVEELFDRFDALGCHAIDWRLFLVHAFLWAEPAIKSSVAASPGGFGAELRNDFYIDGPSLIQLFDQRSDLGSDPLNREEFDDVPLYFEGTMSDERLISYRDLLWELFSDDELIDVNALVLYLSADPQSLRGIQKAFAMAAPVGDENCALDVEMLHDAFHFAAVNAASMGIDDPYEWAHLDALFAGGAELVTFQDLCSSHAGRVMLNNTDMFRRQRFTP